MFSNIEKNEILKNLIYSILPIAASKFLRSKGFTNEEIHEFSESHEKVDFDLLLNFIAEIEVLNLNNRPNELTAKQYLVSWNHSEEEIEYLLSSQSMK